MLIGLCRYAHQPYSWCRPSDGFKNCLSSLFAWQANIQNWQGWCVTKYSSYLYPTHTIFIFHTRVESRDALCCTVFCASTFLILYLRHTQCCPVPFGTAWPWTSPLGPSAHLKEQTVIEITLQVTTIPPGLLQVGWCDTSVWGWKHPLWL